MFLENVDKTVNGKCSNCGKCCGSLLPLTDKDLKRLKYLIKKDKLKPFRIKTQDMSCPFLTLDNKCAIYKNRPVICQTYMCSNFKKGVSKEEADLLKNVNIVDLWELF